MVGHLPRVKSNVGQILEKVMLRILLLWCLKEEHVRGCQDRDLTDAMVLRLHKLI